MKANDNLEHDPCCVFPFPPAFLYCSIGLKKMIVYTISILLKFTATTKQDPNRDN